MSEQTASTLRSPSAIFPVEQFRTEATASRSRQAFDNVEKLPFSVRLVHTTEDLDKAVTIRHTAYARHVPDFAEKLRQSETADFDEGAVVLLAESKLDGSPLGTMRIQTNQFGPLCVEQSINMPDWMQGCSLAEATRLGITGGTMGNLVKTVLFKAFYLFCKQNGVAHMVITARAPIDRQYERLLFEDVFPGMGYIPLPHVNNMPHRILGFNVSTAEMRWTHVKHPLLGFMCYTNHPDIDLRLPAMRAEPLPAPYSHHEAGTLTSQH